MVGHDIHQPCAFWLIGHAFTIRVHYEGKVVGRLEQKMVVSICMAHINKRPKEPSFFKSLTINKAYIDSMKPSHFDLQHLTIPNQPGQISPLA